MAGFKVERLNPLDASFRYADGGQAPLHIGTVVVLRPPDSGFDYDKFVELVRHRLAVAPRFSQVVREVPLQLARPVWLDDPDFDLSHHVRKVALPRPGGMPQLQELVGRLIGRPLDQQRPLWESYFVEGLAGGELAIITKAHPALLESGAADVVQLLFGPAPARRRNRSKPGRLPTGVELGFQAIGEMIAAPAHALVDIGGGGMAQATLRLGAVAASWINATRSAVSAMATAARPAPTSILNVDASAYRRVQFVQVELDRLRVIRRAHDGRVNDVVLAIIAGGLRQFLLSRRVPVDSTTVLRALVPVAQPAKAAGGAKKSVTAAAGSPNITPMLVDLPIGEANPLMRLREISHAMAARTETGDFVAAGALARLADGGRFTPPTLHALGVRAAARASRRLFNLVITNVPGPQDSMSVAGAQMTAVYPVIPLAHGQGLAVGVTSYNGTMFIGFNADRDALGDLSVLARMTEEAVAELEVG